MATECLATSHLQGIIHAATACRELVQRLETVRQHARLMRCVVEAVTISSAIMTLSLAIFRQSPSGHRLKLSSTMFEYAGDLDGAGRFDDARSMAESAQSLRHQLDGPNLELNHFDLIRHLEHYGYHFGSIQHLNPPPDEYEEAVALQRERFLSNPDLHRPGLARSLYNYATQLRSSKRYKDACKVHEEVTPLLCQLVNANPDAYAEVFAASLHDFGICLYYEAQIDRAIPAARDAVTVWRELPRTDVSDHTSRLAASLCNYSCYLHKAGFLEAASVAAREAVNLAQQLRQSNLGQILPILAISLRNFSGCSHSLDWFDSAYSADQMLLELRRGAYEAKLVGTHEDLPQFLEELGTDLHIIERFPTGSLTFPQPILHQRSLYEQHPDAHGEGLARALHIYSRMLMENEMASVTCTVEAETVAIFRCLYNLDPDKHRGHLAEYLLEYIFRLAADNRFEECHNATSEALPLLANLAEQDLHSWIDCLAPCMTVGGYMAYLCRHSDQALLNFESGTAIWRILGRRSRGGEMGLLLNLQFFAMVSEGSGNVDRADALAEEAAEITRRFLDIGGDEIKRFFSNNILTLSSLACCLAARGNYTEAERLAMEAGSLVSSGGSGATVFEDLDRLLGNLRRILNTSDGDDRNHEVANLRSLCDEITVPIRRHFLGMLVTLLPSDSV